MIHFYEEDYAKLRETYRKWWRGELHRPIVPLITTGYDIEGELGSYSPFEFGTAWDFSLSPKDFIKFWDLHFSTLRWHGDAFPFFPTTCFGPGTMAAFLGCRPISAQHTVWFEPPEKDIPIEELHFEADDNNPYLRRVLDVYEAAMEKWHGQVVVGMIDIGGVMDVLQSFRGAENLLTDLYDDPDEVLRCVKELQGLWRYYYEKIIGMMGSDAPGYSQWLNLYCENPSYILQSDFSYMIGPDMFDRFVAPELAETASWLDRVVYHMDGIGQIPHLDSLLKIDGIKGIQWVPGSGAPEEQNWDDLLTRILDAGLKLLSCNQNPDGTPIAIAKDPGQLYFWERYYHKDDPGAQAYAEICNISL
ncbi:MAG: hypothetical protein IJA85_10030 [Clostridia bacterium]|nr:hypothetical protein [Clostridia bacterium]